MDRGGVLKKFLSCQAGGMTVDWVALSASVLMLATAVLYALFSDGVTDLSIIINDTLIDTSKLNTGAAPSQTTFD